MGATASHVVKEQQLCHVSWFRRSEAQVRSRHVTRRRGSVRSFASACRQQPWGPGWPSWGFGSPVWRSRRRPAGWRRDVMTSQRHDLTTSRHTCRLRLTCSGTLHAAFRGSGRRAASGRGGAGRGRGPAREAQGRAAAGVSRRAVFGRSLEEAAGMWS